MRTWVSGTEKGVSRRYRLGIARASLKFTDLMIFQIWYLLILYRSTLPESSFTKQQQRVSQEASKTVQVHMGSMETLFSNDNNLSASQRSFTKQQQWGDKVSGEAIEMAQVQVESQ